MTIHAYKVILLAGTSRFLGTFSDVSSLQGHYIRITAQDYHDVYGTSSDLSGSYKIIKDVADDLLNAKLRYKRLKTDTDPGTWAGGVNWIEEARYNEELKCIELRFTQSILPLLLDVRQNYTYYNLRHIGQLSSMYAIRLYELMMMWRKKEQTPTLRINYMRTFLGVPDDKYTEKAEIKYFTQKVIRDPIKEITKKTDINMEYTAVKDPSKPRETIGYTFGYVPKNATIDGETGEVEDEQAGDGQNFPPKNDDSEDPELPF